MSLKRASLLTGFLIFLLASFTAAWAVPDFTFVHLSDVHFPHAAEQSRATVAAIPTSGTIELKPYGVPVAAPSFAIVTGDANEFGGGGEAWEGYLKLWQDLPFPVYHQLGNHDNTWDCNRPRLRALFDAPPGSRSAAGAHKTLGAPSAAGSSFYAFESHGVKFIGWDTATPQDPRPAIATEGLRWLRAEFGRTTPDQPVIFFCHHPLDGAEFASPYDRARLLDLLRTRNVVLLLAGHGHNRRAWRVEGFDSVMGGSTYGDAAGFGVVSIKNNALRVCHQIVAKKKMIRLLEKPLPAHSPFLQMSVTDAPDGKVFKNNEPVEWALRAGLPGGAQTAPTTRWVLDGDSKTSGVLLEKEGLWMARPQRDRLEPGAHWIRFTVAPSCQTGPTGPTEAGNQAVGAFTTTSLSMAFWLDGGPFRIAWKEQLPGSCQSTPTVDNGRLYVGANDGGLYAFDAATGHQLWRFAAGGEVRSQPAIIRKEGLVCFASADGWIYAVSLNGELRWRAKAGSAVYASPLIAGERVICGANNGHVLALEAATGKLVWESKAPRYAIESQVCANSQTVYAGSWDGFLYALGMADGAVQWRAAAHGEDGKGAARYFSPADCAPALAGANVFIADRGYGLTVLDGQTGKRAAVQKRCAAVAASGDGRFVYLRQTNNQISKAGPDGALVWTASVPTGAVPTPVVEAGGYVWALSNVGVLSAIEAATGKVAAQYKASPGLFAFAAPAFDGKRVYAADMGGNLLALEPLWLSKP